MNIILTNDDIREAIEREAARRLEVPSDAMRTLRITRRKGGIFEAEVQYLGWEGDEE